MAQYKAPRQNDEVPGSTKKISGMLIEDLADYIRDKLDQDAVLRLELCRDGSEPNGKPKYWAQQIRKP